MVNREIGVEFADGNQQFANATGGVASAAINVTNSVKLLANGSYGQFFYQHYIGHDVRKSLW